jgi:hypothetical protein
VLIEIAIIVLKEGRAVISESCDSWIWYCEAIDRKSFAFMHERYWLQATTLANGVLDRQEVPS